METKRSNRFYPDLIVRSKTIEQSPVLISQQWFIIYIHRHSDKTDQR